MGADAFWPRQAVSVALQADKTSADYARLAALCEQLGFDGISVYGDLGYQPPVAVLAILAEHTQHVRLGVACMNPFTTHPFELASQHAEIDAMSGHRAYFGIARGAWLDRVGLNPSRPIQAVAEAVDIVRLLLAGDDSGYDGDIYHLLPGARLAGTRPRTDVHVLVGTWGPAGAQRAASYAQECKIGGTANADMVHLYRGWLGAAPVGVVAGAVTVVDDDRIAARHLARQQVAHYLDVVAPLDPTFEPPPGLLEALRSRLQAGDAEGAGSLVPDEVLDRFSLAGDPDEVARRAAALYDAGAARVEFGTPHGLTPDRGLELLGRRVLPQLREAIA